MNKKKLKDLVVGDEVIVGGKVGVISRVLLLMDDTWISAHVEIDGKHDGSLQGKLDKLVKIK